MEKGQFIEKLRYKFDNLMSKGAVALVGMLFLVTAGVIFLAGVIAVLFGNGTLSENVWASIMHTIDAGTITGTETRNLPFLIIMSIVTLCGLFVTSILIGIITTGFEEKLNTLRKGNSRVIEKNHVLILGFNDSIYTIISELVIANENKKNSCIVVLSEQDKETVELAIAEQVGDLKTTRVIARTGSITDSFMLRQCSASKARSIIINEQDDFIVTKAILAINSFLKEIVNVSSKPHIVATLSNAENFAAAEIAGEGNVELILINDAVSRIIAQTCRQPGISNVLIELFNYDGAELYFESFSALENKSFSDALKMFEQAIVLGFKRDGEIHLNPNNAEILKADDQLLLLVEDDGLAKPLKDVPATNDAEKLKSNQTIEISKKDILILGVNDKIKSILTELDNYLTKGSSVTVATEDIIEVPEDFNQNFKNIDLVWTECDTNSREVLDKLTEKALDHILLLSSNAYDPETCDAMTLMKLIHLRDISVKQSKAFNITSEIKNETNQKLARVAKVNDLVVGTSIINLILSQISENRDLATVFKEILHVDGSEIYLRNAANYIKLNEQTDFYTVTELVKNKGEIALGYKKQTEDSFEIVTNPKKSDKVSFGEQDYIIVLAND